MSKVIVNLTSKHRVVVDDYNYTLQEHHPISDTRKIEEWKPLGYYDGLQGAMRRVASYNGLDAGEYDAMSYADAVLDKAYKLIKESKK